MATTLRDIAEVCGMDISTISRALRDDPRVKEATRKRIQDEAQRLGYRPNLAARYLVAGRTKTIWFIIPGLTNPLEREPASHASQRFCDSGYDQLVAIHHNDAEIYARLLERIGQGVADGAIIIPGPQKHVDSYRPLTERDYPMVFLDRHVEGIDVPVVTTDNELAISGLVERLIDEKIEGLVLLNHGINPVDRGRRDTALALAVERGLPALTVDNLTSAKLSKLPKRIGCLSSGQREVTPFVQKYADILRSKQLVIGVFDHFYGDPYPGEKAFVCIQDFPTMADRAVDLLLDMLDGEAPVQHSLHTVPPVDYLTVNSSR